MQKLLFLFDRDGGLRHVLVARWLFLRGLGLVYLSAFYALLRQVLGLTGSGGVLPAAEYLQALRPLGTQRFWIAPTVLWWGVSDHALLLLVWVGFIAAVLLTVNLLPRLSLVVCWISFLSWIAVSQDFGQYQSDGMLLEAGLLAILIAPLGLRPGLGERSLPMRAAWWLLLWEWFRIYFESGVVKLASGDPTWRNLTAMYEYYQNGPLPTWVGWYLQHLPLWFHRLTAGATLAMELVLVFLAFLPRRWRVLCFVVVTLWQVGVIATANYAFLNYLVLILGFLLLDDRALERYTPRPWRHALQTAEREAESVAVARSTAGRRGVRRHPREVVRALRIALSTVLLTAMAYATAVELLALFVQRLPLPIGPVTLLEPFRVANQYGLFATMTPHRYEIEFQGSNDGRTWTAYPFRYKPQEVRERPRIYAPYQPRFDWNLWFASLTTWDRAPIVPRTEIRLLQGSAETLQLFAGDPFAAKPPRLVRAVLYQYWFSTRAELQSQGIWWRRQYLGTYAPTLTLAADGKVVALALPDLALPYAGPTGGPAADPDAPPAPAR